MFQRAPEMFVFSDENISGRSGLLFRMQRSSFAGIYANAMGTYDLDPVSLSRDLIDRRRALREEGRRLVSQLVSNRQQLRHELESGRGRGPKPQRDGWEDARWQPET